MYKKGYLWSSVNRCLVFWLSNLYLLAILITIYLRFIYRLLILLFHFLCLLLDFFSTMFLISGNTNVRNAHLQISPTIFSVLLLCITLVFVWLAIKIKLYEAVSQKEVLLLRNWSRIFYLLEQTEKLSRVSSNMISCLNWRYLRSNLA